MKGLGFFSHLALWGPLERLPLHTQNPYPFSKSLSFPCRQFVLWHVGPRAQSGQEGDFWAAASLCWVPPFLRRVSCTLHQYGALSDGRPTILPSLLFFFLAVLLIFFWFLSLFLSERIFGTYLWIWLITPSRKPVSLVNMPYFHLNKGLHLSQTSPIFTRPDVQNFQVSNCWPVIRNQKIWEETPLLPPNICVTMLRSITSYASVFLAVKWEQPRLG